MAEHQQVDLSLDDVINDCVTLADKLEQKAQELNSQDINVVYIKNGGTFPGEFVSYILGLRGYNVTNYAPHYHRYKGTEGGNVEVIKDITKEEEIKLRESINKGTFTVILDELIDDGLTMEFAMNRFKGIPGLDKEKFEKYVHGAVMHRKPKFLTRNKEDEVVKFTDIYVRDYSPDKYSVDMWLVYPWEREHAHFFQKLHNLIYEKPVEKLRKWIRQE
jgi:hypoxanthine phosphoribosyltransferase